MLNFFRKKPDNRTDKQKIGDMGEELAARYLKDLGYKILKRNYTFDRAEIDIIARKKSTIVFVEVKTTSSDAAESLRLPSHAVDSNKMKNLIKAARHFIFTFCYEKYRDCSEFRFDVIEVFLNRSIPEINHVENAFQVNTLKKRY